MDELIKSIVAELKIELSITDPNFNESLLEAKVKNAYREVRAERRYPTSYSEQKIVADMENFYTNIRNIALYDYNQIGAEFQTSSTESSNTRQWMDRNKMFSGITPFSR